MFVVFSLVVLSQAAFAQHQIQHVSDFDEYSCELCLSSSDKVDTSPTQSFVVNSFKSTSQLRIFDYNQPTPSLNSYSARAPPQ